jgi:predicted DNA-binding transcriptional regulator AlpA
MEQASKPKPRPPKPAATDNPLLSLQQVWTDIGISKRTFYRWKKKGVTFPPMRKIGERKLGIFRSDLERFKRDLPVKQNDA